MREEFLQECETDIGISREEGQLRLEQGDLLMIDPKLRWTSTDPEIEVGAWEHAVEILEAAADLVGLNSQAANSLVEDAILRAEILAERARARS